MRNTVKQSALARWTRLASLVRTQVRGNTVEPSTYHNALHMYRFIYVYILNYSKLRKCYSYIGHCVVYMAGLHFSIATINTA